jgi:phosphohistidine phosphatase
MRRLLLFRHAKAERSEAGMEDRTRKLIERGRKDAAKIGAYMASHGLIPDRVIVSPSTRTQETWKFAAAGFRPAPAVLRLPPIHFLSSATIRVCTNLR